MRLLWIVGIAAMLAACSPTAPAATDATSASAIARSSAAPSAATVAIAPPTIAAASSSAPCPTIPAAFETNKIKAGTPMDMATGTVRCGWEQAGDNDVWALYWHSGKGEDVTFYCTADKQIFVEVPALPSTVPAGASAQLIVGEATLPLSRAKFEARAKSDTFGAPLKPAMLQAFRKATKLGLEINDLRLETGQDPNGVLAQYADFCAGLKSE